MPIDRFGRHAPVTWKPVEGTRELGRSRASWIQHEFAIRIRDGIARKGWTVEQYATLAGTSYDRMAKVLRGAAILRLEDIGVADMLLGEIISFAAELASQSAPGGPEVEPELAVQVVKQDLKGGPDRAFFIAHRAEHPELYRATNS